MNGRRPPTRNVEGKLGLAVPKLNAGEDLGKPPACQRTGISAALPHANKKST